MSAKPEQHLKVGEWWYLPQQDKLVKLDDNGEVCQTATLDNLCQKALNYFLVNAGRLVTRDELLSDVWGVRDVSDGRISRVIRVLRVALGDDSREPRYIETIPKRGFRFIAPIAEVIQSADEAAAPVSHQPAPPTEAVRPAAKSPLYLAVISMLLMLSAGWFYWQQPHPSPVPFGRFEPLSSMDGLELYPDVSQDGLYLVYGHSADFESKSSLVVQNLETLEKKIIKTVHTGGLRGPTWSPDRRQIAYQHLQRDHLCEIRLITLNPGTLAAESDELLRPCGLKSVGARMSWSPDGKYLVYPDWRPEKGIALQLLPLAGGPVETLTNPPQTSLGDFAGRFSPDGNFIAFIRDAAGSAGQVWLLDMATRSSRMLFQPEHSYPGNVSWTTDGTGILFPSGTNSLSVYELNSGEVSVFAQTNTPPRDVLVSRQNRIFASVGRFWQSSMWKTNNPLENPVDRVEEIEFAVRSEGIIQLNPQPDGPAAVLSNRSGSQQVWLYYPDGRQTQVSTFTGQMYPKVLEFSPDGKKLLVLVNATIWLLQEDKAPVAITAADQQSREPSWSSDSETIYFKLSNKGRWQIMQQKLSESEPSLLSDKWDFYQESPDGAYFITHSPGDDYFVLTDSKTGTEKPLMNMAKFNSLSPRFILRSKGIYFSESRDADKVEIFRFNLQTGLVENTRLEQKYLGRRFDVSQDEMFIYQDDGKKGDVDIAELKLN